VAVIAVAARVLGGMLPLPVTSPLERTIFATAFGLAMIAWLTFLLGLAHALYAGTIGALAGAAALGGVVWGGRDRLRLLCDARKRLPVIAALAVPALYLARLALYPPIQWDVTMYHLALARAFVRAHAVQPIVTLRMPVFPILDELLMTSAFALGGELAAQLCQWLVLLLFVGATFSWGRRFSPQVGALSAALVVGTPIVVWTGTSGDVDVTLALFVTLGLDALSRSERGWLAVGAVALGLAAACKYTGLFFVAVGVLFLARRPRAALRFLAIALAVLAPFYAYITYFAGNPLFPFFGRWLGTGYWSAGDVAEYWRAVSAWGGPRTVGAFARVLFDVAAQPGRYLLEAQLSVVYAWLLPVALIAALFERRVRPLSAAALAYLTFWFLSAQQGRYLLPILPMLALAGIAGAMVLVERARLRRLLWPLTAVAALALAWPSFRFAHERLRSFGAVPIGRDERDQWLARRVPGYDLVARLNRAGGDYRLHGLAAEQLPYYVDGEYLGDHFGPASYRQCPSGGRDLYLHLTRLAVDYLLADHALLDEHFFRLVGREGRYHLYRLRYER
jgi:hypothetical protein